MTSIVLRPASTADLAFINEVYNHYVVRSTCTYQEEPSTAEERRAWFDAHGPRHPVIVAEAEGRPAGWGALSLFHGRAAYRFTVEDSVYVRPDLQRRGLGSAMLAHLIEQAARPRPSQHPGRHRRRADRQHRPARAVRLRPGEPPLRGRLQVRPVAGRGAHATDIALTPARTRRWARQRTSRPRRRGFLLIAKSQLAASAHCVSYT